MSDHAVETTHAAEGHTHPPYMKVFWILATLTIVELVVPFLFTAQPSIGLTILIVIAVWKILYIGRYFMHLKFDNRVLGMIACTPAVLASIMALGLLMDYV